MKEVQHITSHYECDYFQTESQHFNLIVSLYNTFKIIGLHCRQTHFITSAQKTKRTDVASSYSWANLKPACNADEQGLFLMYLSNEHTKGIVSATGTLITAVHFSASCKVCVSTQDQ